MGRAVASSSDSKVRRDVKNEDVPSASTGAKPLNDVGPPLAFCGSADEL